MRTRHFFPPFKDEGELIAWWGEAQLIKCLDGKLVLKGGSKEDRIAARVDFFVFARGGGEGGLAWSLQKLTPDVIEPRCP